LVEDYLVLVVAQGCILLSMILYSVGKEVTVPLVSILKHLQEPDGIPLALVATRDSLVLAAEGEAIPLVEVMVADLGEEALAEISSRQERSNTNGGIRLLRQNDE
jgi:hypothetical protein